MKKIKNHYNKKLFLAYIFAAVFAFFFMFFGQAQAVITASCSASPNPANVNQPVNFTSNVSGGTGSYSYIWTGACVDTQSNCSRSFTSPGNYTAFLIVNSGSESVTVSCSVLVVHPCTPRSYKACYDNDVYWYNSCSQREEKAEECGTNGCFNNQCVPNLNVSCSASPNPANVNQNVLFSSMVSGGTGGYTYSWTGACSGSSNNCSNSFSSSGIKTAYLSVLSGNQNVSTSCSVNIQGQGNRYLACYDDDVYWYDTLLGRQEKHQECGSLNCVNTGSYYCSGNNVYVQQNCTPGGCANNACVSGSSYTRTLLVQHCAPNQTCQNGQCVNIQECSSGPCCENGRIKPSSAICNTEIQTEYSCPWGSKCGDDVGKRTKSRFQYCSGNSSQCTGSWSNWIFGNWQVADYCSASEVCVSGSLTCRASSLCSGYIKNYRKACYGNNVFWYDNYGVRQGLHKSCNDNNSCTLDTCFLTTCENRPICDSKECIKGSDDYCQICNHIGDGDCNCSETFATAPADCQASQTFYCPPGSDSAILILAKKSNSDLWNKNISAAKKETIDFMIILTNKNSQPISNGIVKIILPEEIKQKGSVNVNNVLHLGSIESGIVIDFLEQNQIKIITFQGEILAKEGDLTVETSLIAGNYSAKDYSKIVLERPETQIAETQMAAIGGVFANLFKGPYSIFFLLLLAIAVLYFIIKIAYKSLKQEG